MKRFYENVSVEADGDGWAIRLDDRPIKTPTRNDLRVPTEALAREIALEWEAQGDEINPETMPLNALAQGALDQVAGERERIVGRIASFADSDMLYYRAEDNQAGLMAHQTKNWDPLLDWARSRYDVSFTLVHGIMHQSQAEKTVSRLTAAVEVQDDFALAAMLSISGLTGSLVATLALVENVYDVDTIWMLSNLEELWQEQQWGSDELAQKKRDTRAAEFRAGAQFLKLSRT